LKSTTSMRVLGTGRGAKKSAKVRRQTALDNLEYRRVLDNAARLKTEIDQHATDGK
jgi:hypothetical protein